MIDFERGFGAYPSYDETQELSLLTNSSNNGSPKLINRS